MALNIAGALQPTKPSNPLGMVSQLLSLKDAVSQSKLQQMQLAKAQRGEDEHAAMTEAFKAGGSYKEIRDRLQKAGMGDAMMQIDEYMSKQDAATLAQHHQELENTKIDAEMKANLADNILSQSDETVKDQIYQTARNNSPLAADWPARRDDNFLKTIMHGPQVHAMLLADTKQRIDEKKEAEDKALKDAKEAREISEHTAKMDGTLPTNEISTGLQYAKLTPEQQRSVQESRRIPVPGSDIPYPDDVEAQKIRMATAIKAADPDSEPGSYVPVQDPVTGELKGGVNFKTGRFVAVPKEAQGTVRVNAPPLPVATQEKLAGWKVAIQGVDNVTSKLDGVKKSMGPVIGRVKLSEVNKLGGKGLSKDEMSAALAMRELLMSRAFAEGGKQLTETEKKEFEATLPSMDDTFDHALIKAIEAKSYLQRKFKSQVDYIPERQRNQIDTTTPGVTPDLKSLSDDDLMQKFLSTK